MARPATAAVRLLTSAREPVRLATTANIDVDTGGLLTIDGVLTEVGDRVLVKDQTDGSENGIRTVSEGQWYRASDARTSRTMQKGTTVYVQEGTANAGTTFVFNTLDPVIGDTNLDITADPFSGPAQYVRDFLDVAPYVPTRVEAKLLDPTKDKSFRILGEGGRNGVFNVYLTSSLSALDAAQKALDTQEGVYFSIGAYTAIRQGNYALGFGYAIEWFGAVDTNTTAAFDSGDAILCALALAGTNGKIVSAAAPYATSKTIKMYKGQLWEAPAPSGDVFGGDVTPGCSLKLLTNGIDLLHHGADPTLTNPISTFGGGLINIQFDGDYKAPKVVRLAATATATYKNLTMRKPQLAAGKALWLGANQGSSLTDNTIRNCTFENINCFAYGNGHAIYNESNGAGASAEGGVTGCTFNGLWGWAGGGSGSGDAIYFSAMDTTVLKHVHGYLYAGGTGKAMRIVGNAAVPGQQVQGNELISVRIDGELYCDGRYVNNKMTMSAIDATPTVTLVNGAQMDIHRQPAGYGTIPGFVWQQPTKAYALDASNNSVTDLFTAEHLLNAVASAPAAGIGAGFAFRVQTSAGGTVKKSASIESVATGVGVGTETFKLVFGTMFNNSLSKPLELTVNQLLLTGNSQMYFRAESALTGAADSAGVQLKTGNHSNVWQMFAKGGALVIGVASVADYTTWSTAGDISHAGHLNLTTGKEFRVNGSKLLSDRKTGWTVDTGTAKRTANTTYSGTASAAYVQAEMTGVMNALRDATQTIKALKDDLHNTAGHGIIGT